MRLLLDTHFVIAILRRDRVAKYAELAEILGEEHSPAVSVVSLWEIAIKTRLGKLHPGLPLQEIADFLSEVGMPMLPVETNHALGDIEPEPQTRDPFDRMLLVQCRLEGMRLATTNRALADHPLAWRGRIN